MALVFVAFLVLIGVLCPPVGILMLVLAAFVNDADNAGRGP